MKLIVFGLLGLILVAVGIAVFLPKDVSIVTPKGKAAQSASELEKDLNIENLHPMAIEKLRARNYPPSGIVIEETLTPGSNYDRYIASHMSDGLKIRGLLTIPRTEKPRNGYPSIVFIHGYIAPDVYQTTERYGPYQDGFARNGFITFKTDLRGHADSEGVAPGAHFSEAYTVDTLNAVSALKNYKNADPERIGVWGHSNGGEIGLRAMAVSKDIKAGNFWAGVVGSFPDMLETYNAQIPFLRNQSPLQKEMDNPSQNPEFWQSIDPYTYLKDINGPIELHHGTADDSVPLVLSQRLEEELKKNNKKVQLFVYEGGDHNLGGTAFGPAMERSIEFFKKNL